MQPNRRKHQKFLNYPLNYFLIEIGIYVFGNKILTDVPCCLPGEEISIVPP